MKIIDIISQKRNIPYFSFEYFPPKTEAGMTTLYEKIDRMAQTGPSFVDITWGAGGSTSIQTLEMVSNIQKFSGVETQMHLTCTNMEESTILDALNYAKEAGIQNILALRGDPPSGQEKWESSDSKFCHASDLVSYIRSKFNDYFGISVAGYPEGHLQAENYESDLKYLKEKVEHGGELIISQLFYDVPNFIQWVKDCRKVGIRCPILPGILPIGSYTGFMRMIGFCKTKIPEEMGAKLQELKDNSQGLKSFGVHLCTEICLQLLAADIGINCFHFYSLNQESAVNEIVKNLGLVITPNIHRSLPWLQSAVESRRKQEGVRPIFWLHRPQSYMKQTLKWKDLPRSRWESAESRRFDAVSCPSWPPSVGIKMEYQAMLGSGRQLKSLEDIQDVFMNFFKGQVDRLPWLPFGLPTNTNRFGAELLCQLAKNGIMVINFQCSVNGEPSDSSEFGWGPSGGRIFQKAYVEFFCQKSVLDTIGKTKSNQSISYYASSVEGDIKKIGRDSVTAMQWGVFPGCEILQPLVFDPSVLVTWRKEAFDLLYSRWRALYESDEPSFHSLSKFHDEMYHVCMVDEDYTANSLHELLSKCLKSE